MVLLMFSNYLLVTPTSQIHLQTPQPGDLNTKKHQVPRGLGVSDLMVGNSIVICCGSLDRSWIWKHHICPSICCRTFPVPYGETEWYLLLRQ